jgi:methyl-accepting chemotaxis protein
MRLNVFKNIRLSLQLYALVFLTLAIASGLIFYAMQQVRSTQGTLKHTIDNRMVSGQSIQGVADALSLSLEASLAVIEKKQTPEEAHEQLKSAMDKARDDWDNYFLGDMIPEEQKLADETTPLLDAAYIKVERLLKKLETGEIADLARWRDVELRPALVDGSSNLKKLIGMQMTAANLDLEEAKKNYELALRNSVMMLAGGGLLALVLAWGIIHSAMRKLGADPGKASSVARRVASGDLEFEMAPGRHDAISLMGALRQMKDSLLHSKLDYEGQINAIAKVQGVIECTPDGNITKANDIFLKLMGYSLDDVKGKHYSLFVDLESRGSAGEQVQWSALQRGENCQGEFALVTRDRREVWLQGVFNPIVDSAGKPFKVVAYLSDITRQRQEALLNAAFRGALSQLDANVMVADNDLKIIFMNPAAERMLARAQASFRKDLPAFDAAKLLGASVETMTREPGVLRAEIDRLTDVATREEVVGGRSMKTIMSPMKDDTGRRLGTVLEWFDRTQEVATESELHRVIAAVTAGNLENRISLDGKRDFFLSLSRGINELVDAIATVVTEVRGVVAAANQGDLTRRVDTQGKAGLLVEIGSGINELTSSLSALVSQAKRAAAEVSRGADEISRGNADLSQRTEEQASSLEETASSMEEMTSTVKQNADNAGHASRLAVAARDQAEKGGAVVSKAVKAMVDINDASKKIADIIGVIDEIAFQTNLLALNAAVEAARAGEQGRGFAVVASEVRNLAGRSATAAKEIKALIQDTVRKVDEGSSLVTQSGSTLEQLVVAVKKVTDIVSEIAAASGEQSAGIDQVNKAVMQLDELTQQNAALVEEASAASQAMAEQARGLNGALERYRVDIRDAVATKSSQATAPDVAAVHPNEASPVTRADRRGASRPWNGKRSAAKRIAGNDGRADRAVDDTVWKEF